MKRLAIVFVVAAAALAAATVDAQSTSRIRGTIVMVDLRTMTVKPRDGGPELQLRLADNVSVAVAKAARFDEIQVGDYVGTTTRRGPDGSEVAVEVHYLAATVPAGQSDSDLEPGSRMTNANVRSKVVGTASHELTLQFSGGEQKVVVPAGTPIVRTVPGLRADLLPGEYVFVIAQSGSYGTLTALRVQVSKDGVRPPQ